MADGPVVGQQAAIVIRSALGTAISLGLPTAQFDHAIASLDLLLVRVQELTDERERDYEACQSALRAREATVRRECKLEADRRVQEAERALRDAKQLVSEAVPYMEAADTNAGPVQDWLARAVLGGDVQEQETPGG